MYHKKNRAASVQLAAWSTVKLRCFDAATIDSIYLLVVTCQSMQTPTYLFVGVWVTAQAMVKSTSY